MLEVVWHFAGESLYVMDSCVLTDIIIIMHLNLSLMGLVLLYIRIRQSSSAYGISITCMSGKTCILNNLLQLL